MHMKIFDQSKWFCPGIDSLKVDLQPSHDNCVGYQDCLPPGKKYERKPKYTDKWEEEL